MKLHRRQLLQSVAMGSAALMLAGCTIVSKDGKITATLDVNKLVAYGEAGVKAANTVASYLESIPPLTPYMTALEAANSALDAGLKALLAATGGKAEIDYDSNTWKTKVDSIFSSLSKINYIIANIAASQQIIPQSIKDRIKLIAQAFDSLMAFTKALLGIPVSAVKYGAKEMSEAQVLSILNS